MKHLLLAAALHLTTTLLSQSPCAELSVPDLPPWPVDNALMPWHIEVQHEGQTISGNAYLKYRCSPASDSLAKPFIFVEGIDFSLAEHVLKLGDFGWPSFIGEDPSFSMLANAPAMLNALREAGYDILLLDFADGARDIRENAALLRSLIEKVKQHTAAKEPIVLAGASMGGQVTRYALSWMEAQGISHCCRLWISLDSPHKGANIPLGIQHSLAFLADASLQNEAAMLKFYSTLLRPAARQMLRYQVPGVNSLFDDYYNELEALGFPQEPRTIGIANGAMDGTPLPLAPGSSLYEYDITVPLLDLELASLSAFAAPGNSGVLFHGNIPSQYETLIDGTCAQVPVEWLYDDVNAPSGMLALDHAPGGVRNTISEFVLEVNDNLTSATCPADTIEVFQDLHSFISTASALGMADDWLFAPIGQALAENATLSPFDYTHGPLGENEAHSAISIKTAQLILAQSLAGENPLGPVLDNSEPNGGLFNFRDSSAFMVHDLEITGGGQLRVNANLPAHFGASSLTAITPAGGHFDLRTNPCGAHIWLHSNGALRLGDGNAGSTATLTIGRGSKLTLSANSILQLDPGSSIVIEDGGQLVVDGGELMGLDTAILRVEEGGILEYSAGSVRLVGSEGGLHMHGELLISTPSNFTWGAMNESTAPLHWHAGAFLTVTESPIFRFLSSDMEQLALHIHDQAELVIPEDVSSVWLKQCAVRLDDQAKISCTPALNMHTVSLSSPDQNAKGWAVRRHSFLYQTHWVDVPLEASLVSGLLEMQDSEVSGSHAYVFVKGRTYDISNTDFSGSRGLGSEALGFDARVQSCQFNTNALPGATAGCFDRSEVDLFVQQCSFSECVIGLSKALGQVNVQCCTFSENQQGIACSEGARLSMSNDFAGGFNLFDHNSVGVHFSDALPPLLENGYNQFQQEAHELVFHGSIQGDCNLDCAALLNATRNTWTGTAIIALPSTLIPGPLPEKFDLWTLDTAALCTPSPAFDSGCTTQVLDQAPVTPVACGDAVPKFGLSRNAGYVQSELNIRPNPALEGARLCNAGGLAVTFEDIVDANGKVLFTAHQLLESGACTALPDLTKGVYALRIRVEGNVQTLRYTCL